MTTSEHYRSEAARWAECASRANDPNEKARFERLAQKSWLMATLDRDIDGLVSPFARRAHSAALASRNAPTPRERHLPADALHVDHAA
jgi:hypothetical protein